MRKTFGQEARSYRQEAAILYYSPVNEFQFPLNQDKMTATQPYTVGWQNQTGKWNVYIDLHRTHIPGHV